MGHTWLTTKPLKGAGRGSPSGFSARTANSRPLTGSEGSVDPGQRSEAPDFISTIDINIHEYSEYGTAQHGDLHVHGDLHHLRMVAIVYVEQASGVSRAPARRLPAGACVPLPRVQLRQTHGGTEVA